jgi:hypothetical protein
MKIKTLLNATSGICVEILYALMIMFIAFLVCLMLSY